MAQSGGFVGRRGAATVTLPAGQYLTEEFPVLSAGPTAIPPYAKYSVASAPRTDGRIELSVERLPNGEVSPYLTQDLAVGHLVELRGPIGGWFVWRDSQTEPIQLVAGGSGIVPLMAMIRSRATGRSAAPFRLLYSVRNPASVWYRDELQSLTADADGVDVTYLYTRSAPPKWSRPPGRIDPSLLAEPVGPRRCRRPATYAAPRPSWSAWPGF
jgi:ferredoxin-NADP reductase